MNAKSFLDTNILIYAHDTSAGERHARAKDLVAKLWSSGAGVLSTQVLQEFCANLRRKAARLMSPREVRAALADYSSWEVVVNSPASISAALDIEEVYKISFWDALILQAAEVAGAETLYTEDLNHGQRYGPVRVVNPFRS